jgi:nucleoside-diphosphate-sugar epimerase
VHSLDVGEAFRLAALADVRGAFNLAADPILDPPTLAALFGAKRVRIGPRFLRGALRLAWGMHLVAAGPGWVDLAFAVPLIDSGRAERELGWRATRTADAALLELVEGLRDGAGLDTPPLAPRRGLALASAADPQSWRGRVLQPGSTT